MQFGDFVTINISGQPEQRGRIYYAYGVGIESLGWNDDILRARTELGPNPMRFINSNWHAVLVHEPVARSAASMYLPEDVMRITAPFELTNTYTTSYFSDWRKYREGSTPTSDDVVPFNVGSVFLATRGAHAEEVYTVVRLNDDGWFGVRARQIDPCGETVQNWSRGAINDTNPEWVNA